MTEVSTHKKGCSCHCNEPLPEKQFKLSDLFNMHWDEYCKHPTKFIEPEQYKAVNAIRTCQTAVLGVDYYSCPECGEITKKYHTCKHRFCPSCSWKDTLKWVNAQVQKMMNVKHRHAVFTLPHDLHPLIIKNKKAIYNILMRTSADTFKDWIRHKFKIEPGIISVLHTFGETKELHVHVHMIVSWGGEDIVTGALKEINQEYVKFGFLQDKFRCKFEDELIRLYDTKNLIHDFTYRQDFMQYVKNLNRKGWILHIEPPMQSPKDVITYIGRYSKRACISEYKITDISGETITFKYRDYRNRDERNRPKENHQTLHYKDFFPRLLQHVPLPNFRIVRYYGKYNQKSTIIESNLYKNTNTEEIQIEEPGALLCKHCNCLPEYLYTVYDLRLRNERTEPFDESRHEHVIIKRLQNIKQNQAA